MSRSLAHAVVCLLASTVVVALSCALTRGPGTVALPAGFPEPTPAGRSLAPAPPGEWKPPRGPRPLRVIQRSPTRYTVGTSAIRVTFDQPVHRLGPARKLVMGTSACPIRITPATPVRCRWVGAEILKLELTRPLQNARRFRVTVPAGVTAISGGKLAEAVSWSFETPRLRLVRTTFVPGETERADRVRPGDRMLLWFNRAVDPARVARHLAVRAGKQTLKVSASRHDGDPRKVLLTPDSPWPAGARLDLTLTAGLPSVEGPLTMTRAHAESHQVHGPLAVELRCGSGPLDGGGSCRPMSNDDHRGVGLRFSEPVTREQLKRHVRFVPPMRGGFRTRHNDCEHGHCSRSWWVASDLLPRRAYRVVIALPCGTCSASARRAGG